MTEQMPNLPTGVPATPPPPGWYNDPNTPHLTRYWDGLQWTQMTRTRGQMRWRTFGKVAKWVAIGWVAVFVLVIIIGALS